MSYKSKLIPLEKVKTLPSFHRETIPESYLDVMGHMNVRWYVALFDKAADSFFASFSMNSDYFATERGLFALQQFIHYLAEVHMEQSVVIHVRLIERSAKRLHFMYFMINETTDKLACTMEVLCAHADLNLRRTSPFPPHIAKQIDAMLFEQNQLDWVAPISGALKA